MTRSTRLLVGATVLPLAGALALAGCTPNTSSGGSGTAAAGAPIAVTITDDGCQVSSNSFPSGVVTFNITNEGTVPNEFEVLTEDQLQIVSERENIGPGSSADLQVAMAEGTYNSACKPNMVGDLVGSTQLTVTPGESVELSADDKEAEDQAVTNYTSYVKDQAGQLKTATEEFTQAYVSGDTEKAKQLYPLARQHYERIEPSAGEKFGIEEAGDIDAAIDVRIQDLAADAGKEVTDPEVLASWTGWHRIEADLFSEEGSPFKFSSDEDRKASADQLNSDTDNLYKLVYGEIDAAGGGKFELSIEDVVTGASDLINEVASTKIVGEEETFSHTDLYDFQANVEGARVAYGNVKDLVTKKDQALADKIERQFSDVEKQISDQSTGETDDGVTTYKSYETIATVQKDAGEAPADSDYTEVQKNFSTSVNALGKSLGDILGTVLSSS